MHDKPEKIHPLQKRVGQVFLLSSFSRVVVVEAIVVLMLCVCVLQHTPCRPPQYCHMSHENNTHDNNSSLSLRGLQQQLHNELS